MIIANPIYDVVFKHLMLNERIAKFFIGTLLDETIIELSMKPQERTIFPKLEDLDEATLVSLEKLLIERLSISVFRVDFVATVKTAEGEYKKVLIEIQKAKNALDLMRFRTYLAEHYKTEDEVEIDGKKEKTALPIVTVYMLGFKIVEIDAIAIKVKREYWDLINQQVLTAKSSFVEGLTHDCYVVQIPRIEGNTKTKLESLLSIFEQNYFITDKGILKEYKFPIEDETVREMVSILQYIGADEEMRKAIEDEREAYRLLEVMAENRRKELETIIKEKNETIKEKDEALKVAQAEKEAVQAEKEAAQKNVVINSRRTGLPVDTIASITGFTIEQINEILTCI
jgi:hypothetical protein